MLSVSFGGSTTDYFNDGTAIAAFEAIKKGIPVIASAGNSGPLRYSASNVAPWILTVAASTMDREFEANVKLGNGAILKVSSFISSV